MKRIAILFLALLCATAHARNVQGTSIGGGASGATSGPSGSQGEYGSRYSPGYTLGDEFQPWPQAEMKQYAKPRFESSASSSSM